MPSRDQEEMTEKEKIMYWKKQQKQTTKMKMTSWFLFEEIRFWLISIWIICDEKAALSALMGQKHEEEQVKEVQITLSFVAAQAEWHQDQEMMTEDEKLNEYHDPTRILHHHHNHHPYLVVVRHVQVVCLQQAGCQRQYQQQAEREREKRKRDKNKWTSNRRRKKQRGKNGSDWRGSLPPISGGRNLSLLTCSTRCVMNE